MCLWGKYALNKQAQSLVEVASHLGACIFHWVRMKSKMSHGPIGEQSGYEVRSFRLLVGFE